MKFIDLTKIAHTKVHNDIDRLAIIQKGDLQSPIQTINKVTLLPGHSIKSHVHNDCEEIYLFTAGGGEMTIANKINVVNRATCVIVSPGEYHSVTNNNNHSLTFYSVRSLITT